MSKPISWFLRRAAANPGGIATGGGETGFHIQPQEHLFSVALWGAPPLMFKDVLLPKGAIITGAFVIPYNRGDPSGAGGAGGGVDGVPATGGQIAADLWSALPQPQQNPAGGSSAGVLLAPTTPANAFLYTSLGGNRLASQGSFTLGAAVTTVVPDLTIVTGSKIVLTPTNASAATLQGSAKQLFISAKVANTSFSVATANAVAAAGTETFDYEVFNTTALAPLANDQRVRFRAMTTITPFNGANQLGNGATLVGITAIMPAVRK